MNSEPQLMVTAVKMFFLLAMIIGGLWGVSWFAKNKIQGVGRIAGGRKIKVIESHSIGIKKNISLVQVPGAVLVLGIAGDNITMLTEIKEAALSEVYRQSENDPEHSSFSDQLKRFSSSSKKER